jgi:hypothetical protein
VAPLEEPGLAVFVVLLHAARRRKSAPIPRTRLVIGNLVCWGVLSGTGVVAK